MTRQTFTKLDWFERCMRGADDLTHAEFRVLTVMWTYASSKDGGDIRPGLTRIINESQVTKKTALAALRRLIELGYLLRIEKGGNAIRKGWASTYMLSAPHRLSDDSRGALSTPLDDEPRGEASTPLDDPQGGYSFPEGGYSAHPRGVVSTPEGGYSVPLHPVIDPVIDPGIESVTSEPPASDTREPIRVHFEGKSADLEDAHWRNLLDLTQMAATASGDELEEIREALAFVIGSTFGNDYAAFFETQWTIPAKAESRYEAAVNMRTFLRTCKTQGLMCFVSLDSRIIPATVEVA